MIQTVLSNKILLINEALDYFLPGEKEYPQTINRAMRYSIFAGGKRIRPLLILLTTELFGSKTERGIPPACAMEMIHTYSLIHDDLPAMDNDDYRRGCLTSHKVFGEATAILAGDALLTLAFDILSREGFEDKDSKYVFSYLTEVPAEVRLKVIGELSRAAGVKGMIGGQIVDLESEGKNIAPETIDYINSHKTGALLVACFRIGVILGGGGDDDLERLTACANAIGSTFQVVDDLLDLEGNREKMGKDLGADLKLKKATYLSHFGLKESKALRDHKFNESIKILDYYGNRADILKKLIRFMLYRDY
ncbi:MAG: polyprenyl synthetase family protein [Firmicutes bacterium]|nr:polyprenyl synthetase family protein [Bacillota bacterium]